MFTVEAQTTTRLTGMARARWLWHRLTRLGSAPQWLIVRIKRRTDWFTHGLTLRKAMNLVAAVGALVTKRVRISSWPAFVVVDLSPQCNLHCTVCLHAHPNGNPDLEKQRFSNDQRMSLAQYQRLVDEIKGHALGVLLYYLGDPLVHPDLVEICRITHEAGLNSHVSTNFSFPLTDRKIEQLITSGLTHLTVCVDGLSEEKYRMTRVGGRLSRVRSNLQRACACRRKHGRRFPRIEVQYIKFQHNLDEVSEARRIFTQLGVDQVHELWGWLHNYTDRDPGKYTVLGPRRKSLLPRCHWPYLFTVVRYDGQVLPCCAFRLGQQYTTVDDPRALGNAFETSLWDVWTSPAYDDVRRLARDPAICPTDPKWGLNFCDSCPRLFESDYHERTCRFADEHRYEDLYTIGADGRPVRRDVPLDSARVTDSKAIDIKSD